MSAVRQHVSFQSSAEPQELRIVVQSPRPLRMLAHNGLWLEVGGIGGAEHAPWETSYEGTLWAEPAAGPARDDVSPTPRLSYVGRVMGMSHRFVPHLVGRILVGAALDEGLEAVEVTGSLPLSDDRTSVSTDDVTPLLADLAGYPGVWPDLGFRVEHVPSTKHEVAIEIHMSEPIDATSPVADLLTHRMLALHELTESFANERGKPVNLEQQRKKMMPLVFAKRVARHAFAYEVKHAHAPYVAMALNLLAAIHRREAAIERVRVTARAMPTPR